MSDLQCPATAVLLDDAVPPPAWLARLPVAERLGAHGAEELVRLVEDTADLFRGETFVVAAPAGDVAQALRERGLGGRAPAVVEVDSAGWRRVPPPDHAP
ncbi:hypothetical protein GCM10011374_28850 [Kocuria dechangensis]|uniref:Uncharacterized protein n=1 Tax=Kocuria dechangensis TaxID=1176249 RepID=A0A917H0I6_9MICC|nr:hypothetical protein [Kocuria dechangensis]GGG63628.1 hypothetical protein GCM10011374_28850 [Kocuria dechangensis]